MSNIEFLKTPDMWDKWFDEVEDVADFQWLSLQPFLHYSKGHTVEIAAGGGRFTKFLIDISKKVTAVDVNDYAVKRLENRFGDSVKVIKNNGKDLKAIKSNSVNFVFSFDSMVHFSSELVFGYIDEIYRVLKPECTAFIHLSNLQVGDEDIRLNPHWRAIGGAELFKGYAKDAGFFEADVILWDWEIENLDCLLLLKK